MRSRDWSLRIPGKRTVPALWRCDLTLPEYQLLKAIGDGPMEAGEIDSGWVARANNLNARSPVVPDPAEKIELWRPFTLKQMVIGDGETSWGRFSRNVFIKPFEFSGWSMIDRRLADDGWVIGAAAGPMGPVYLMHYSPPSENDNDGNAISFQPQDLHYEFILKVDSSISEMLGNSPNRVHHGGWRFSAPLALVGTSLDGTIHVRNPLSKTIHQPAADYQVKIWQWASVLLSQIGSSNSEAEEEWVREIMREIRSESSALRMHYIR